MNTFTIFGCSYSYGAGLYYYEWLKDKPDGFRIPNIQKRYHQVIIDLEKIIDLWVCYLMNWVWIFMIIVVSVEVIIK